MIKKVALLFIFSFFLFKPSYSYAVEQTTSWQATTYSAQLRTISSSSSTNQNGVYAYTTGEAPYQWYLRHKNPTSFSIPSGSTVTGIKVRAYSYSSLSDKDICVGYALTDSLPAATNNCSPLPTSGDWVTIDITGLSETDLTPFNSSNIINLRLWSTMSGEVTYVDAVELAIVYDDGITPTPTPSPEPSPDPSPSPDASTSGTITFSADDPFITALSDTFKINFFIGIIIIFLLAFVAISNIYKR